MFITQANGVVTRVNQHVYLGEKMKTKGKGIPHQKQSSKTRREKDEVHIWLKDAFLTAASRSTS